MEVLNSVCISKTELAKHLKCLSEYIEVKALNEIRSRLRSYIHFPIVEDGYSRNVIFADQEIELVVAVWGSNFGSKVHNHGCSSCIFSVLEGAIYNIDVIPNHDFTKYSVKQEQLLTKGSKSPLTDYTYFHQIKNRESSPSVTLHLYTPPITNHKTI